MHPKMAQDCPLCFSKEGFQSWMELKDSLVSLATRSFSCPLCLGIHEGLEKFTLHLVSHEMEQKNSINFHHHSAAAGHQQHHDESDSDFFGGGGEKQTQIMKIENHEVPTISIKDAHAANQKQQQLQQLQQQQQQQQNPMDTLDELLADFSEFVRQEDRKQEPVNQQQFPSYDNQVKLKPKAPNPLRLSPKTKSGPLSPPSQISLPQTPFPNIQTPLPLHHQNPLHIAKAFKPPSPNCLMTNIQVPLPLKLPDKPLFDPPTSALNNAPLQVDQLLQNLNKEKEEEEEEEEQQQTLSSPNQSASAADPNGPNSPPSQVQCTMCGWNFDNDNFLQLHMVLMHSKRSQALLQRRMKRVVDEYKCRDCNNCTFIIYEDYVNHLRQVHNDNRFVCHICAKIFKLRGSLLVHLRVVHNPLGDGAHHCKICNRKFTNKHRRDVHENKHSADSKQFECLKCGMAFEEKGEFEIHMESHNTEHKCTVCGRTFYTQAALFIHSVGHRKSPPPPSQTTAIILASPPQTPVLPTEPVAVLVPCSSATPPQAVQEAVNGSSGPAGFKCQTCDKVFKRESHLNQHVKVHDNKQWECDVCKKTFTTKYFLKKHKRLHTGETPYACNICGKSFTFQQSYHKHMLYHTDDKPYSCSQCGRAFKELSTLQNHERIHSGERPFACETCGKSFRQRVSYLVHRRIHTGVMPYVCNACGKCFRYKVTQRTHKCQGRSDDGNSSPNFQQTVTNPLAEENAINTTCSDQLPINLPQQIKDDLLSFRRAQGRRLIQGRLQGYLQKSKERANHSEVHSPVGQLEQLSLSDNLNQTQPLPNIDSILSEPSKEDCNIKTESVDDFDLQAFL